MGAVAVFESEGHMQWESLSVCHSKRNMINLLFFHVKKLTELYEIYIFGWFWVCSSFSYPLNYTSLIWHLLLKLFLMTFFLSSERLQVLMELTHDFCVTISYWNFCCCPWQKKNTVWGRFIPKLSPTNHQFLFIFLSWVSFQAVLFLAA